MRPHAQAARCDWGRVRVKPAVEQEGPGRPVAPETQLNIEVLPAPFGPYAGRNRGTSKPLPAGLPHERQAHADSQPLGRALDDVADQPDVVERPEQHDRDVVRQARGHRIVRRVKHDREAEQFGFVCRRAPSRCASTCTARTRAWADGETARRRRSAGSAGRADLAGVPERTIIDESAQVPGTASGKYAIRYAPKMTAEFIGPPRPDVTGRVAAAPSTCEVELGPDLADAFHRQVQAVDVCLGRGW